MNEFDRSYEEEMRLIDEGSFKSLAAAGLMGLGALGGTPDVDAYQSNTATQSSPRRAVRRVSDETVLTKTLPLTKWAEGYRDTAYNDSKGIPTIGYGSNLNSSHIRKELEKLGYSLSDLIAKRTQIKEADAEEMLKRGMVQALSDAKQFVGNWKDLDPIAQIIILDMSYNLGLTRLSKFHNFKEALESLDYDRARDEMINSKWYNDVGRRSKRLVSMMDQVSQRT